jgi:UV DNA damage repair endonuclease
VFHYSEGKSKPLDRSHSDFVTKLPVWDGYLEIEAKMKDLAVLKILNFSS